MFTSFQKGPRGGGCFHCIDLGVLTPIFCTTTLVLSTLALMTDGKKHSRYKIYKYNLMQNIFYVKHFFLNIRLVIYSWKKKKKKMWPNSSANGLVLRWSQKFLILKINIFIVLSFCAAYYFELNLLFSVQTSKSEW